MPAFASRESTRGLPIRQQTVPVFSPSASPHNQFHHSKLSHQQPIVPQTLTQIIESSWGEDIADRPARHGYGPHANGSRVRSGCPNPSYLSKTCAMYDAFLSLCYPIPYQYCAGLPPHPTFQRKCSRDCCSDPQLAG